MSLTEQLGVIDWEEFEKFVHGMFRTLGEEVTNFHVLEKRDILGIDGEYEIDASVEFEMFKGAKFLILLECKNYKQGNNITRDHVMILNQKLQSLHAQKGMMITTSDFQSGAVEFATAHGIALIKVSSESMMYVTKGYIKPKIEQRGKLMGVYEHMEKKGVISYSLVRNEIKDQVLGTLK